MFRPLPSGVFRGKSKKLPWTLRIYSAVAVQTLGQFDTRDAATKKAEDLMSGKDPLWVITPEGWDPIDEGCYLIGPTTLQYITVIET